VQEDGRNVTKLSGEGLFGTRLNVTKFSGREVKIRTRVRGDSISVKPNAWNGVKLMLRIRNAEGKLDYPQFHLPDGTFPWTDVDWTVRIPDNAVEMDLAIGLEKVTGNVWFDTIHISTQK
jgi:hypothetical protein